MGDVATISFTIGIIALIEGIVILLFPDWSKKTISSLMKDRKRLRRLGMVEVVVALFLLIIAILFRM